ncbi:MAG: hypothetical protein GXO35_08320 [Gammaproteobacteria bacterium]|nr:hypothetical protein [Gammaproteobacteria bacterium]
MENLQIGAFGWQHDAWLGTFYPEDLPEDWRLDYYSNAFRTLLVPQQTWQAWALGGAEVLEEVQDAVEGDFFFYLAIESVQVDSDLTLAVNQVIEGLSERVAGLVILSEAAESQQVVSQIERLSNRVNLPLTLVTKRVSTVGDQAVVSLSTSKWQWTHAETCLSGQPLAYIEKLTADGRAQTALLQSFYQSLPLNNLGEKVGAAVIVGSSAGGDIDMKQLANFKVVCEFLGY